MNQRDRLIELIKQGTNETPCKDNENVDCTEMKCSICEINGIADHLIANGVIVPPVKLGDTVYIIENPYTFLSLKKPLDGEVVSIHQREHGLYLRVLFDGKKINGCVDYHLNWRLNKEIFLSREDAEKALEGRHDRR